MTAGIYQGVHDVQIRYLVEKAKFFDKQGIGFDEENTKTCFIMPLFLALGYDVFNPLEFMAEVVFDTRHNGREKVDFAIHVDDVPRVIIEAKRVGSNLKRAHGQLQRYYNSDVDVRLGVLTNGMRFEFYGDFHHANIMDEEPYFILDLLNFKESDLVELQRFTRPVIVQQFLK